MLTRRQGLPAAAEERPSFPTTPPPPFAAAWEQQNAVMQRLGGALALGLAVGRRRAGPPPPAHRRLPLALSSPPPAGAGEGSHGLLAEAVDGLARHLHRVYLRGTNSPAAPLALAPGVPPELAATVSGSERAVGGGTHWVALCRQRETPP